MFSSGGIGMIWLIWLWVGVCLYKNVIIRDVFVFMYIISSSIMFGWVVEVYEGW